MPVQNKNIKYCLFFLLSVLIVSKLFSQNKTLKTFNYPEGLKWENPEWENPGIFDINKEKPRAHFYIYKTLKMLLLAKAGKISLL